ncbi:MAG: DDE-type integrase/transposase/recombinase [Planctomycetota bacterium]
MSRILSMSWPKSVDIGGSTMLDRDVGSFWPAVDAVSTLFMRGYLTARARAFSHPSPMVRILAQRDHAYSDAVLLQRELAIFRSQRQGRSPKTRAHYAPKERAEILQLMRLRGWSTKEAAAHFVVHPNTIRNWKRALRDKLKAEQVVGASPWNKLHEGVRWLVHEIRALCPERDFGTRTIARHIMRSGIQISRASVRRILEEQAPRSARVAIGPRIRKPKTAPDHLLRPHRAHHVWHVDLTTVRILWMRFEIAAIIDGYSRKIIGLHAYKGSPATSDLLRLIDSAIGVNACPRFMITDRGGQFQKAFHSAMIQRGVKHARSPPRAWQFNARVERLFWSLKCWWRVSLIPPNLGAIQKRLDAYALWHNRYRPHAALGRLTPSEAALGTHLLEPVRFVEGGELVPSIKIRRQHIGNDPRLLYPMIKVMPRHRSAA